jgi:hypothetical protein
MSQTVEPNFEIATIAISTTDSGWVDLKGKQLVAVVFPATMNGTSIKYRGRYLDSGSGNIIAQKNSTSDYQTSFTANEWVPLDVDVFCGVGQVQIVSSASETGGARTIILITRPVN